MIYRVLIVDDHPIIAASYEKALEVVQKKNKELEFEIKSVSTIDDAILELDDFCEIPRFELIFLDIKLPKSSNGDYLSGEDLGAELRNKYAEIKIIISTTYNDNYRINNILKSVDPDAFLVKNDITPEELIESIETVLVDTPYYSPTVSKLLRKHIKNDIFLDKIDRRLLYELSIGTKMVELPKILPMSIGGIERRKRQLREIFNVTDKADKALIDAARDNGFL